MPRDRIRGQARPQGRSPRRRRRPGGRRSLQRRRGFASGPTPQSAGSTGRRCRGSIRAPRSRHVRRRDDRMWCNRSHADGHVVRPSAPRTSAGCMVAVARRSTGAGHPSRSVRTRSASTRSAANHANTSPSRVMPSTAATTSVTAAAAVIELACPRVGIVPGARPYPAELGGQSVERLTGEPGRRRARSRTSR